MPNNRRIETSYKTKSTKAEAFCKKIAQTQDLISSPLLILNVSERNPNYVMYTLEEEHASPAALIINPDGSSCLIVNNIEFDLVAHLEKHCVIRLYAGMTDFYKCLNASLPSKQKIYVEAAENIPDLDLIPRRLFTRLESYFKLFSAQDILAELRAIKTSYELSFLKLAVNKTKDIFSNIDPLLKPGTKEETIAHTIMTSIITQNAGISFKPIVSSGPRIINPHPVRHTSRELKTGDWLIIDFGLSINGYTSDMTRTYLIGGEYYEHEFFQTYQQMLSLLYKTDLNNTTPQNLAKGLREISSKNKLDCFEKHGYGHGLGAAIHDIFPTISTYKGYLSEKPFEENVVFTFEPGFYNKVGNVGLRIEDDFVVKNGKAVML